MITEDRGGMVFDTAKIGKLKILRQDVVLPGETVSSRIEGQVRLESLRERDAARINARIDRFMTPIRWLWSDYAQYIKDGPEAAQTNTLVTVKLSDYGLGSGQSAQVPAFFRDAILRVYNEHYKWPEATDATAAAIAAGLDAVPLPMPWNRLRDSNLSDTDDYQFGATVSSGSAAVDIRDLEETMARFRRAIDDEYLSFDRWKSLLQERYGTNGSSEIDQVPLHVGSTEGHVSPRSLPAMDGPSLGSWQSLYDFNVNHMFEPFSANEHMVMTDVLLVRYASITEDDCNYLAVGYRDGGWKLFSGDPGIMGSQRLEPVSDRELNGSGGTTVRGYLPFGWQYRTRWNQIGEKIDSRNSFPLYRDSVTSGGGTSNARRRNATGVSNAFTSTSFDDMVIELYYDTESHMPLPSPSSGPGQGLGKIEPHRLV